MQRLQSKPLLLQFWLADCVALDEHAQGHLPPHQPAMSVAELEARSADLWRRQAELGKQLKDARRQLAAPRPKTCTPWMRQVAMKLFAVSEFQDNVVAKYLERKQRSETVADVRAWFRALPPAVAAGMLQPGDDEVARRQLAEAEKFWAEARLVDWLKEQNAVKGIAPTATAVIEQAGPGLVRQGLQRNRYRWVKRCMKRWGGRRVHLGGGDGLSAEEFRQKVALPRSSRPAVRVVARKKLQFPSRRISD